MQQFQISVLFIKEVSDQQGWGKATQASSQTGAVDKLRYRGVWRQLLTALLVLLVIGLGCGTAAAQSQTLTYVANRCTNMVSVINIGTNRVVATIPVGISPFGVAMTPDGTLAYVTNQTSNSVSVIDTATNVVVATVPVEISPQFVAITPDGTLAYVTNARSHTVSVIDIATNTVVDTVPAVACPSGITMTPAPHAPKSIEECKKGGFKKFGPPVRPFKNKRQCIKYVHEHASP